MNVSRAKQILSSPTIIPVTYQGEQILIQSVDERTETARIYLKENRESERTVPVAMLQEHA
ncbi:H-type small acid-soluble spore protein [Bacillus kexueae]|uniref:H-type small acid-soluble spore protein n=1 Tax=Aeribacillus kexueae TaxID=2078952 RepID=UPI001FAE8594|nr:H-type small acid-soluble spore protein [Bacillus kexueae]